MRKMRQVNNSVATVIPEIGFDEEPISPVTREETVTKRKPKAMMSSAPRKFMCSDGASMMPTISPTMPAMLSTVLPNIHAQAKAVPSTMNAIGGFTKVPITPIDSSNGAKPNLKPNLGGN